MLFAHSVGITIVVGLLFFSSGSHNGTTHFADLHGALEVSAT